MRNFILVFVLMVTGFLSAQTLINDPAHSRLGFGAIHLTISTVEGVFKEFSVNLNFTKDDLSDASFSMTAKTASVDTGVGARDSHLKSEDFFEVKKYPELTFTSTSFTKIKGNQFAMEGDLSLHGITKNVMLTVYYNGFVAEKDSGSVRYGFTIKGNINRNDFGIGPTFPDAVIGNQISIISNLEFVKK